MYNYRRTETPQIDFPDPKYLYTVSFHVIGSHTLNILRDSKLLYVRNHGDGIILKINSQPFFISDYKTRYVDINLPAGDPVFEHECAYLTATFLLPKP